MTLFFDRCFGKRLPEALRMLKPPADIISYYDRYQDPAVGPGIPDDAWLGEAGREGWTVVTMDNKWHLEDIHIAAIAAHRVGAFVLSGAQDATWARAKLILADMDRLIDLSRSTPRPFLYRIEKTGRITQRLMELAEQGAPAGPVAQSS